jgi:hypothetical protein
MDTMGELFVFFVVSLSAAFLGWGMVVFASRIERERQERHAERYGIKKGPAVPPPKPSDVKPSPSWVISGPPQRPTPQQSKPASPERL